MNVIYMGTPEFAVPALERLHAAGNQISLVLAKPDMPRDRGKKMQACPVKAKALELGLPVETPERLRDEALISRIRELAPDIIIVAAYGKILSKAILDIPRLGCVNIHASLLPAYRGAAPIQRAILAGEKELGVTLMYMSKELDAGDMIAKASIPSVDQTSDEMFLELAELGADLLMEQLPLIAEGKAERTPQDASLASYAPMIEKEDGRIDFTESAYKICCRVRAMNSWPSAFCQLDERTMKVHEARELTPEEREALPSLMAAAGSEPGTVLRADKKGLLVACGEGDAVVFTKIQLPGKKAMEVSAFLLGNKIEIGHKLL